MDLDVVYKSLEKIGNFIDAEDNIRLKDCVGYIKRSQNGFTIADLKKLPSYILVSENIRGKYRTYLEEFEEKVRLHISENMEITREQLNDESWNPEKDKYDFKVTESMVKNRICSSAEYKTLFSGKTQLNFAYETIKSITRAMDTLQFLPPSIFCSKIKDDRKNKKNTKRDKGESS